MIIFNSFDNGKKLRTHLHTHWQDMTTLALLSHEISNEKYLPSFTSLKVQTFCGYTIAYVLIFWHFAAKLALPTTR